MKTLFTILSFVFCLSLGAQIPKLNSMPGATGVVFLDFDGQTVNSTVWNNGFPVFCASPNLNNAMITEAFDRVAEDYRLFNVNITTDSSKYLAAPLNQRIRVVVTPTNFIGGGTAGIAYMNSFIWGDDTPAFVFTDANVTAKFLGEACSHESGHSLGCAHQVICNNGVITNGYNPGQGNGEIGWAPIMGYSVDRIFSTWHNGKNSISCNDQDDISIIASRIMSGGLRADDVVNTITNAPLMTVSGENIAASGLINNSLDLDVFKLNVNQQSMLTLKIVPPTNTANQPFGNVDLLVSLLNSAGTTIKTYNYTDSLKAEIDTILNTGTYYISVDGTSNINTPSDYGSTGSYTVSGKLQTTISLPIYKLDLWGTTNNAQHILSWDIQTDEPITKTLLEYSLNGLDFAPLQQVDYRAKAYSYKPFTSNTIYYRLKSYLRNNAYKISNIISMQGANTKNKVSVLNNTVNDLALVTVSENMQFELYDANGRGIQKGNLLTNKINQINMAQTTRGIYFLKAYSPNETVTSRILKN
jgi:hypothetical protein